MRALFRARHLACHHQTLKRAGHRDITGVSRGGNAAETKLKFHDGPYAENIEIGGRLISIAP